MPEYNKTIVPNETTDLRKKLTNWAALSDISVLDSLFQDRNIKLNGKKVYRSKVRFSIGFLFLWIFLGFVVGLLFGAAKSPAGTAISWFIIPLGYVVYYFVKHRDRTVEFEILSIESPDSPNSPTIKIAATDDFDAVMADVNALVMKLT